jgi:hypothetical protein
VIGYHYTGGFLLLFYQSLMMEAEAVSETQEINSILERLIA